MRCAGIAALVVALGLPSCARERVAEAGFWFDRVTYDLPVDDVDRIGGPIRPDEQTPDRVNCASRARKRRMPACGFDSPDSQRAIYRVSVVQDISGRALPVAGASRRVPFGGGVGSVSFRTLGAQAVANAPRDAESRRALSPR